VLLSMPGPLHSPIDADALGEYHTGMLPGEYLPFALFSFPGGAILGKLYYNRWSVSARRYFAWLFGPILIDLRKTVTF